MNQNMLPNCTDRAEFNAMLRRHVEQSVNTGSSLGVMVVDINRFRKINWAFGYKAGDAVLLAVARVLTKVARKRDLIARIGDNQFAMILPGLMNVGHAVLAASKLMRLLGVPIQVEHHTIRIVATVGIAVCPDHGNHGDMLLLAAEKALHRARDSRSPYSVAMSEREQRNIQDTDIEFGLQSAVASGEMELFYQPKVHMRKMVPVGAEALVRWNSPVRGRIQPDDFIPVAEKCGLMMNITQWAINTALRESHEWTWRWGKFNVAVNLSPRVLYDPNLVDMVRGSLAIWEANADALILEVTESSAMANPETVFSVFRQIKEMGARIALDDFGTGYSSLAHFREIPANELKLDKTFVKNMVDSPADRHIAKLVIDLAHSFDLNVVAEGVEDVTTYKLLARLGCDCAQGFFIGKPMPHRTFCAWLKAFDGLTASGPRLTREVA